MGVVVSSKKYNSWQLDTATWQKWNASIASSVHVNFLDPLRFFMSINFRSGWTVSVQWTAEVPSQFLEMGSQGPGYDSLRCEWGTCAGYQVSNIFNLLKTESCLCWVGGDFLFTKPSQYLASIAEVFIISRTMYQYIVYIYIAYACDIAVLIPDSVWLGLIFFCQWRTGWKSSHSCVDSASPASPSDEWVLWPSNITSSNSSRSRWKAIWGFLFPWGLSRWVKDWDRPLRTRLFMLWGMGPIVVDPLFHSWIVSRFTWLMLSDWILILLMDLSITCWAEV